MTALTTFRAAMAAGIELSETADGRLSVIEPEDHNDPDLMAHIAMYKPSILEYLRTKHLGALVPPETKGISGARLEAAITQDLMTQARDYRRQLKEKEASA